jgi:UDP:flavonoid glycosyltransferase YjiC (YdhE family)
MTDDLPGSSIRPMRIAFGANPALGHLLPLLPLAEAARDAGHDVVVIGGRSLEPVLVAHRIRHVVAGPKDLATIFAAIDPGDRAGPRLAMHVWQQGFAGYVAPQLAAGLIDLAHGWRPDIVVHEDSEQGTWIAAERLGIPHVALQATAWRSAMGRLSREPLGRIIESLDLPRDPDLARWHRYGFLATRPPSLLDPDDPMPDTARPLRPVALDESPGPTPMWVEEARDATRRVTVTMGTVGPSGRLAAIRMILDALATLDAEVVAAIGPDLTPADLGTRPRNVRVERYVPMSRLLPASDAVVCHAGSGTMLAALAVGVPLLLLPVAADQPENARRCAASGAGIVIELGERTPEAILAAVRRLLDEPAWGEAARSVAAEIAAMPAPASVVAWLEGLVRGGASRG